MAAFPKRIFYRTLFMQSVLVIGSLAASALASRYFFQRQFLFQVQSRMRDTLTVLSHGLNEDIDAGWCGRKAKDTAYHFAIGDAKGGYVCDSRPPGQAADALATETFAALERGLAEGAFATRVGAGNVYGVFRVPGRGLAIRAEATLKDLSETLTLYNASLLLVMLLTLAGLGSVAVWLARRLVFPMGRLLIKTQNVLAQLPDVPSKEDLGRESFDEWAELETNIDNIRRDLARTTQHLSREQVELETVLASISDAILAVDPDGNPLFFNSRFQLLFGGPALQARQAKLWGIFRDPAILDRFNAALKDGVSGETKAIPIEQEGGLRRYFSLSVAPLRRHDDHIYGAVGIFHDVSELKSAEQMRIDFVANVSHELRTPLTVIKGYADTLTEDVKKAGGGPMLDQITSIARNADRLMALMNDLLDLSSIESTDIIQKDPLSTEEVTTRAVSQIQKALESKRQKVETHYTAKGVIADHQRVEQVLVNLLSNANKYTQPEGRITVSWENEGGDILLKVANDGPAIPVKHQARLFERFYRIDKARSREQGGTGLGLAIVKHIMQRHGGTVWVESRAPQGATFICRFPGV